MYEAEQVGLGRRVAVKLMRPELADDREQLERFRREARAAAQLGHPNIVQLFDFAEAQGGEPPYLVLELVAGPSLFQLLKAQAPIAPERAVRLGCQILAALGAAHGAGIVHRDIKPGNIVVADVPGVGELAKVLDFGIARMQESEAYQRLTRTGVIIGTPRYMSPEQATGMPLDGRADLWALGVILYAALTGRFPFEGTPSDVLIAIVSSPVPPMERSDVPPALEAAVRMALEKKREDRHASAASMAQALRDAQFADTRSSVSAAPVAPIASVAPFATGPMRAAATQRLQAPEVTVRLSSPTDVRTNARPPALERPSIAALANGASSRLRWIAAIGALAVLGLTTLLVTLAGLWASDSQGGVPAVGLPTVDLPAVTLPVGESAAPATSNEFLAEARRRAVEVDPSARLTSIGGIARLGDADRGTSDRWGYIFATDAGRTFCVTWRRGTDWMVNDSVMVGVALEQEPPDSTAIIAASLRDCPAMATTIPSATVGVSQSASLPPLVSVNSGASSWVGRLGHDGSMETIASSCR